jgi:hypothetical protein
MAVVEYSLAFCAWHWDLGRMFLDLGLIVSPSHAGRSMMGLRRDFVFAAPLFSSFKFVFSGSAEMPARKSWIMSFLRA